MTTGNHTKDSLSVRPGLPKRAVERSVTRALQRGLCPEESTGNLRRYFDHLRRFERSASNIRIYGNHVYIFEGRTLVTVLALPGEYKSDMQQALERRETAESGLTSGV